MTRATHWSCGQYVLATTGARLKPISMTTAPVTTGGSARWMRPAPAKWMIAPAMSSATPTQNMAPDTWLGLPPAA